MRIRSERTELTTEFLTTDYTDFTDGEGGVLRRSVHQLGAALLAARLQPLKSSFYSCNQCNPWFVSLISVLSVVSPISAQDPAATPPAEATPIATSTPSGTPGADATGAGSTTSSAMEYLFNRKPQEGTAAKEVLDAQGQAKTKMIAREALGGGRIEDPQTRTRFEEFLGMEEISQQRLDAYQKEYDLVLSLLRERKTPEAWKHLLVLADYRDIDAGVSWELANRIESIWNADRTTSILGKANDRIRKEIDTVNRNADMISDTIRDKDIDYQRRLNQGNRAENRNTGGGNQPNGGVPTYNPNSGGDSGAGMPSVDSVMGKLELTEAYLKSLEMKAKIKMNELKAEKLFDQAKADFAEYITTLFESGRHRHVLLAADFWRRIFDQGEYPVSMAQQVNAALEMHRDVQRSIDVFNYRLDEKQISNATDRLQTAFMVNDFHPAVLGLPRARKAKVEAFTTKLDRMQNMIEARDFTSLESLLAEMKLVAPDFDTTKPLAIVNAVKLESRMRLGKAKLAAQKGDTQLAMQEFQSAAEAWPGNPELETSASTFFEAQDVGNQSLTEFDRLVEEKNYRAIFEKQLAFAPAMKDYPKRQEQLKDALEKIKTAEMASEKANLLRANGDVFGAWETVELAVANLPGDIKLNALRGELAGKGAEFVAAINKAKEAEARKDLGFSLSWYAVAQRYYPASQMANEAIERISKELLGESKPIDQASL